MDPFVDAGSAPGAGDAGDAGNSGEQQTEGTRTLTDEEFSELQSALAQIITVSTEACANTPETLNVTVTDGSARHEYTDVQVCSVSIGDRVTGGYAPYHTALTLSGLTLF